jgi:hypothetical protein
MLNVFITIDTEFWPRFPDGPATGYAREIACEIDGETKHGRFGLAYQMDVLDAHGLKADFFVESLFPDAVGPQPLVRIVGEIQARGHGVQLHVHPEWLARANSPVVPSGSRFLKDYSIEDQTLLIARGLHNLRACGARGVCAFRAGGYGANFDTLRALARNGIPFDTSHNTCYLGSWCGMQTPFLFLQPRKILGVHEFPITFFSDRPGHYRHLQLCACSACELEGVLLEAWRRRWHSVVLVSHSFELIKHRKQVVKPKSVDGIVLRRFQRLCEFLSGNRDKFRTGLFSKIAPDSVPEVEASWPLRAPLHGTVRRYCEQVIRRCT